MSRIRQIRAVSAMNLRNIPQRIGSSLIMVIGNAGVVAVLISVLSMAVGFSHAIKQTGRPDRVIIVRGGSTSELTSVLSREATQTIMDAPHLKKDPAGRAIASADLVIAVNLQKKGSRDHANVTLRGLEDQEFSLRPELRVTEGRMFEPGKREIVVGVAAQKQFDGLAVGNSISLGGADWLIVGAFASGGDEHESELLADAENVMAAYRRNSFSSITVMLDRADSFEALKAKLTSDPTLSVEVVRETDYLAALAEQFSNLLTIIGYLVGGIMSVGAVFAALNSIYSAVSSRRVEIATLRAIGFAPDSVVVSVILEALVLALGGGAVGAALAWVLFNGNAASTLSGSHTQIVFHLMVTPALIALGLLIATAIGLIGGILPAARAARLPVATAIRGL